MMSGRSTTRDITTPPVQVLRAQLADLATEISWDQTRDEWEFRPISGRTKTIVCTFDSSLIRNIASTIDKDYFVIIFFLMIEGLLFYCNIKIDYNSVLSPNLILTHKHNSRYNLPQEGEVIYDRNLCESTLLFPVSAFLSKRIPDF
jgi:hypothetical protein